MNAIRKIRKVENGKVEIELPKDLNGEKVEIIILTNTNDFKNKLSLADRKKSIRKFGGILHKYAKPELIPFEKDIAWSKVAKEKYDSR
jgi:hypothetical protein